MAKICKSCGEYYKGEYCEKCGYGNKNIKSKSLEKLKKSHKPLRFMTEDEKLEFYAKQREQRVNNGKAPANANSRRGLLILMVIVAVGIVFAVLIKNGNIFKIEKTDVVEQYFNSLSEKDFDKFTKSFPTEIKNQYIDERKSLGYSKDEYMEVFLADLSEMYGDNFNVTVKFGAETLLEKSEYDMTDYKETYGSAPSISEAYELIAIVNFEGSNKTEEVRYNCYVAKIKGSWKIFNIEYNAGIVNKDMEIEDSDRYAEKESDLSSADSSEETNLD